MITLQVTDRDGGMFSLTAPPGYSVMEAIRESGHGDIQALCGGTKACATCHVFVNEEWLDRLMPADADEDDLLDTSADRRRNSRLACQIMIGPALDGLGVIIAPEV